MSTKIATKKVTRKATQKMADMTTQEKLDADFPELEVSPLVEELRGRSSHMPRIAIDTSWILRSACIGVDPNVFFPHDGSGVKHAKSYCAKCPVRNECLEYAMLNHIEFGVWGGASERQRARLAKERKQAWQKEKIGGRATSGEKQIRGSFVNIPKKHQELKEEVAA